MLLCFSAASDTISDMDNQNEPSPYFSPQNTVPTGPAPIAPTPPTPPQQPQPLPQPPVEPPAEPKKSFFSRIKDLFLRNKKVSIITSAGTLVLLAVGGYFAVQNFTGSSALAQSFRDNSPYVYKKALTDVSPKKEFKFAHSLKSSPSPIEDEGQAEGYYSQVDLNSYVGVYTDPLLSKRASSMIIEMGGNITVGPPSGVSLRDEVAGDELEVTSDGEWGLHQQYYLAEFVDFKSGEKLAKPLVTPFSVKSEIAAPASQASVTTKGELRMDWAAVDGAEGYYVVYMNSVGGEGAGITNGTILGQTTETTWTDKAESYKGRVSEQNTKIAISREAEELSADVVDGANSKDKARSLKQSAALDSFLLKELDSAYIGVIAIKDGEFSPLGEADIEEIRPQLPIDKATYTAEKDDIKLLVKSFDKVPSTYPVVMADGSIARLNLILDQSKVKVERRAVFEGDLFNSFNVAGYETRVTVPYTIKGTLFSGNVIIYPYGDQQVTAALTAKAKQEVAKVVARNQELSRSTGLAKTQPLQLSELASLPPSTSKPSVPYKIHASNPLAEFIAANMLNGERVIDISSQLNIEGVYVNPYDAIDEAIAQNPLILLQATGGYEYISSKNLILVNYGMEKDEMKREQEKLDKKVKEIASSIAKQGMSDADKVTAIDQYIVANTVYSDTIKKVLREPNCGGPALEFCLVKMGTSLDEVRNVWSLSGVILDGDAVCVGYAKAFHAIASAAGLESVYIEGVVDSSESGWGHAWNKVNVDGKWRVVDTTWNDAGDTSRKSYLMLTDAQVSEKRFNQESKGWMADVLISKYAAV